MMDLLTTELFPIDDNGLLFISPVISDWAPVHQQGIEVIIDLEGTLDQGVSTRPGHLLYIYHHIYDEELPNLDRMHAVAELGSAALARLRERRPGALYNERFAEYLSSLPAKPPTSS